MAHSILIVDSRREFIRTLQKALEGLPHAFIITGVMSGEEGLLEARLNPVDLLITESRLPGMSGSDLIEAIQAVRPGARAILLGDAASKSNRPTGAAAVVNKSGSIDQILAEVAQLLNPDPTQGKKAAPVFTEIEDSSESPADTHISDRMARLRQDLKAVAVTLVSDTGQVMIRAGSIKDIDFETAVLPSLMTTFNAGLKVSRFLGQTSHSNIYFYQGEEYDLAMSTISGSYALIVATRGGGNSVDRSRLHAIIQSAQQEIAGVMVQMGVPLAPEKAAAVPPFLPGEELDAEVAELDDRLDSLLTQSRSMKIKNADDFWKPDEAQPGAGTISADSLSYEQAQRLGLVFGEETDEA